ncbi:MAG: hypothetical protein ACOVOV_06905 [Dolichospermum sp.]
MYSTFEVLKLQPCKVFPPGGSPSVNGLVGIAAHAAAVELNGPQAT